MLSCLAAGYAETGRLDEAFKSLDEARAIAQAAGDTKRVAQVDKQMALYRQRRPPVK